LLQLVDEQELTGATGLVGMGTFLAILLGTACGGLLIGVDDYGRPLVALAVMLLAIAGFVSSRSIPRLEALAPAAAINWNPLTATWHMLAYAWGKRIVFVGITGISWFWFLGSVYLAQLPNFTRLFLGGDETVVTLLLALFSIGVGAGSLMCERLTGHRVDVVLVPVGALGMTLFGVDLALTSGVPGGDALLSAVHWLQRPAAWRTAADVLLLGASGGLYIVPLYALVQQRTEEGHRARVIAANNILNALFMVSAAVLAIIVLRSGFSIPWLFGLVAALNALIAVLIICIEPEFRQSVMRRFS
jgi:hypothetical protein